MAACGDDDGSYWEGDYNSNPYNPSTDPPAPITEPSTEPVDPDVCVGAADEAVTLYMSADDSNSQAQPVWLRAAYQEGGSVSYPSAPREYEYLNYYDFEYASAPPGQLRIVPELRYREDLGEYSLLVAVVAPALQLSERRPWNLVFSVDTSGSMGGMPIENAKDTVRAIARQMREGDVVSIVSWGNYQHVVLEAHHVSGPDDPYVLSAVNALDSSGSTDLHAGLVTAYDLASRYYSAARLNRVVLISDGGANTGITDAELIGAEADREEGDGVFLVGVGTSGTYDHQLMDTVTDVGRGAYLYIPDAAEAQKVFGPERILSNLEVAALDVRLEVTLPPQFVLAAFHGEEVSTNPDEVREQHLAPNDQMLYHANLAYCGEADAETEALSFRVTWSDPFTREAKHAELTLGMAHLLGAPADHLDKAEILIDYARLLTNADALDATGWPNAQQALLDRMADYELATADPDMAEVSTVLGGLQFW